MSDEQDQTELLNVAGRGREPGVVRWSVNFFVTGLVIGCGLLCAGFGWRLAQRAWQMGWQAADWLIGR